MKPIYNQLYTDPNGRYYTFERTGTRKKPYSLRMAQPEQHKVGGFYSSRMEARKTLVFKAISWASEFSSLSLEESVKLTEDWQLEPVPIFNGYLEVYAQMLAESERLRLPQHYRDDVLIYDRQIMCSPTAPDKFLWILRSRGSHLYRLDKSQYRNMLNPNNYNPVALIDETLRSGDPIHHYYYCENGKLQRVTFDYAKTLARDAVQEAKDYARKETIYA